MKHISLFLILALSLGIALPLNAQGYSPTCIPTMRVTGDEYVDTETTQYDGNAPMYAVFEANPQDVGPYEAPYEWRFSRQNEQTPFLVRYDENTTYEFTKSGSYYIELRVSFVQGTDTITFTQDTPFAVSIAESRLEVPNAFTPNGDGTNDLFTIKEESYQSIVEFHAMVFSRSGKKLYEWHDISGGWDGRSGGHDCPDGAYYLNIQAKGADGHVYNIRKTINLLRTFQPNESATR